MFRALLAHPQEVLHYGIWYIECVLCQLAAPILVHPTDIKRTEYTKFCYASPPEDEQVMLETRTGS
jgi:hypothetical protein